MGTTEVAWIALGSNVGHRGLALSRLRDALETEGARIEQASSEIVTRPVGARAQADFHNQVIRVRSPEPWPATRWLTFCQNAERSAGRKPTYLWGPRVADADILLLGEHGEVHVETPDLHVPHPQLENRPFLLRLLREIGWTGDAN